MIFSLYYIEGIGLNDTPIFDIEGYNRVDFFKKHKVGSVDSTYYPPFYKNTIKFSTSDLDFSTSMNYLSFEYLNRTYYYFIDKLNYISENVVSIDIVMDTIQTYFDDIIIDKGLLSRSFYRRYISSTINRNYIRDNLSEGKFEDNQYDYMNKNEYSFLVCKSTTPIGNYGKSYYDDTKGNYQQNRIQYGNKSSLTGFFYTAIPYSNNVVYEKSNKNKRNDNFKNYPLIYTQVVHAEKETVDSALGKVRFRIRKEYVYCDTRYSFYDIFNNYINANNNSIYRVLIVPYLFESHLGSTYDMTYHFTQYKLDTSYVNYQDYDSGVIEQFIGDEHGGETPEYQNAHKKYDEILNNIRFESVNIVNEFQHQPYEIDRYVRKTTDMSIPVSEYSNFVITFANMNVKIANTQYRFDLNTDVDNETLYSSNNLPCMIDSNYITIEYGDASVNTNYPIHTLTNNRLYFNYCFDFDKDTMVYFINTNGTIEDIYNTKVSSNNDYQLPIINSQYNTWAAQNYTSVRGYDIQRTALYQLSSNLSKSAYAYGAVDPVRYQFLDYVASNTSDLHFSPAVKSGVQGMVFKSAGYALDAAVSIGISAWNKEMKDKDLKNSPSTVQSDGSGMFNYSSDNMYIKYRVNKCLDFEQIAYYYHMNGVKQDKVLSEISLGSLNKLTDTQRYWYNTYKVDKTDVHCKVLVGDNILKDINERLNSGIRFVHYRGRQGLSYAFKYDNGITI